MIKMIDEFTEQQGYRYFEVSKYSKNIKILSKTIVEYKDELSLYRLAKELNLVNFAEEIEVRKTQEKYYLGIKFVDEDSFYKYHSGCLEEIPGIQYFINKLEYTGKINKKNRKLNMSFTERCM